MNAGYGAALLLVRLEIDDAGECEPREYPSSLRRCPVSLVARCTRRSSDRNWYAMPTEVGEGEGKCGRGKAPKVL